MDEYFVGQGKLLASVRDGATLEGFEEIGDVSDLGLTLGMILDLHATGGDETPDSMVMISEPPTFQMTIDNFSPENIARVLYGMQTRVAGATVADEVVVARSGKTVMLSHINLSSFTSLRNAALTVTYVRGVDYEIDLPSGALKFLTGSAITNTQSLRASYVATEYDKVSAGTMAPPFMWLRFNGLNTARDNSPVIVDLYKVQFYPVDALSLIGDEITTLSVKGRIFYDRDMADTTEDGRWLRIRKTVQA